MHLVKSLAVALSMYSKIPVPAVEWKEENMKYAMCFFSGCRRGCGDSAVSGSGSASWIN